MTTTTSTAVTTTTNDTTTTTTTRFLCNQPFFAQLPNTSLGSQK